MRASLLTAHDVFKVTWVAANVCNHSLWNLGATKKYKNGGLGITYRCCFELS